MVCPPRHDRLFPPARTFQKAPRSARSARPDTNPASISIFRYSTKTDFRCKIEMDAVPTRPARTATLSPSWRPFKMFIAEKIHLFHRHRRHRHERPGAALSAQRDGRSPDRTSPASELTAALQKEGIRVAIGHAGKNIATGYRSRGL